MDYYGSWKPFHEKTSRRNKENWIQVILERQNNGLFSDLFAIRIAMGANRISAAQMQNGSKSYIQWRYKTV